MIGEAEKVDQSFPEYDMLFTKRWTSVAHEWISRSLCSSPLLPAGYVPRPQWMPETSDTTKTYSCYVFSYMYVW